MRRDRVGIRQVFRPEHALTIWARATVASRPGQRQRFRGTAVSALRKRRAAGHRGGISG